MRTILEMINTGLDAVMNIAAGTLGPPATLIHNAMKRGTPAVIGFLADQVGLSGVGEKIREIIDTIREKVDNAILAIIDKLREIFRSIAEGAKEAVASLLEWWKEKKSFTIGTKPHELLFQGEKENAVLMVKSTPRPLEAVMADLRQNPTDTQAAALDIIDAEVAKIEQIKTDTGGGWGQNAGDEIRKSLDKIAAQLKIAGLAKVPPTKIQFSPRTVLGETVGFTMEANPLSIDSGGNVGSAPATAGETELWRRVNRRPNTYVQGHLLNHHLHGSGADPRNLIPLARSANTSMETRGESKVKNAVLGQEGGGVGESVVVRYLVEMTGTQSTRRHVPEEAMLPAEVTMQAWRLVADGNEWKDDTVLLSPTTIPNALPADTPAGVVRQEVNLSTSAPEELETIPDIGPVLAARIIALRAQFNNRFNTYDNLLGADGIGEVTVNALKADRFVKLH
jgi:hypothetical protein